MIAAGCFLSAMLYMAAVPAVQAHGLLVRTHDQRAFRCICVQHESTGMPLMQHPCHHHVNNFVTVITNVGRAFIPSSNCKSAHDFLQQIMHMCCHACNELDCHQLPHQA